MIQKLSRLPFQLTSIALVVGLTITTGLILIAHNAIIDSELETYEAEAAQAMERISRKLSSIDEVMQGTRILFDASNHVNIDEFRVLAENILGRHTHLTASLYMPLVPANQRADFEKETQTDLYPNFRITELDQNYYKVAGQRPRYLPVIYQEPSSLTFKTLIGFDYLSSEEYQTHLFRAIDSAKTTISMPIFPKGTNHKYTAFLAVYSTKSVPRSIDIRRYSFEGMIAAHLSTEKLFSDINLYDNVALSLKIRAPNEPIQFSTMIEHNGKNLDKKYAWRLAKFERNRELHMGAQVFKIQYLKTIYAAESNLLLLFASVITGLLLTGLLIVQARGTSQKAAALERRTEEIQRLVSQRTKELAVEKERAHITLESIGDAVITTDTKANIEYMNPVAERLTGHLDSEVRGMPVSSIVRILDEREEKEIPSPVEICLEKGEIFIRKETSVLVAPNKDLIAIDESATPIKDKDGNITGSVLVFHDVSEARKLTQKMMHQATHDALTNLPNRVLLMDRLQQALNRAPWTQKIVAVLFLDLDRFKLVNDTLGHNMGDEMLRQVARRLEECLREGDTVSRLGGDEFVILLPDIAQHDDIEVVAEKIVDALSKPFNINQQEYYSTASIGIAVFPEGGKEPYELMKNADSAMYRAKATGKNKHIFYSAELNLQSTQRLNMETDLRHAINRQQLVLHYQPQLDTKTNRIIGCEALLRWNHPASGLLYPGEFIAVAEESGLILEIGEWVLHEACRQNKAWQSLGLPPISVAVNISDRQFQRSSLLQEVQQALNASKLDPSYLELELTEGILAKDSKSAISMLDDLKKMSVRLSIDDFGTGYSSLAHLKRFPINTLKVDQAFVKDITIDSDDAEICAAVIAMAHNLNLKVIAEGVEHEEQLIFLRDKNCDSIQGYYFSKPIPAEEFAAFLKNHNEKQTKNDHTNNQQQANERDTTVLHFHPVPPQKK